MRRILIAGALVGVVAVVVRKLGPKMPERLMAKCEWMMDRMPESFPPKRAMRGIEEARANTARILALLEEEHEGADEPGRAESTSTTKAVGDAA